MRIDEITTEGVRRLYEYWRMRGTLGRPMSRSALDPGRLGPLLANIMLIEVINGGNDLRFRIAGDEIESRYGRSLRGRSVFETFPLVVRTDTSHQWAEIVRDGMPKYRKGPMMFPSGRTFIAERLLLPMSDTGTRVDFILGGVFYIERRPGDPEIPTIMGTIKPPPVHSG